MPILPSNEIHATHIWHSTKIYSNRELTTTIPKSYQPRSNDTVQHQHLTDSVELGMFPALNKSHSKSDPQSNVYNWPLVAIYKLYKTFTLFTFQQCYKITSTNAKHLHKHMQCVMNKHMQYTSSTLHVREISFFLCIVKKKS